MRVGLQLAALALLMGGCAALLPKSQQETVSPWHTFDDAKAAFDSIELGRSDRETVHKLGLDPGATPNVQILNYSQIAHAVLPGDRLLPDDEVPTAIRSCVKAQERCVGYLLEESRIKRNRVGNFWTDFLNFERETLTTGWRFNALVVLVDNQVVFKQWSGQPSIREVGRNRNPLGPFQGMGERLSTFR